MIRKLYGAIVIILMAIIFYLSHEPASASRELSSSITDTMVMLIEKIAPISGINIDVFHHLLRKSAHFFAFLVLGFFALLAFNPNREGGSRQVLMALGLCVAFAVSDEIHQLFIPGRSGEIRDVLIDSVGSSVGIGLAFIAIKMGRRKRRKSC